MPINNDPMHLPLYQTFTESIEPLALDISGSELHGIICGYLSAGATREGTAYLRALIANPNDLAMRPATLALFEVFTVSQQQMDGLGFEFQLLLPNEHEPLLHRAQAFSDWCEGYTQGLRMAGVEFDDLQDDDAQEAIEHITEFADMDYQSIHFDEEDERSLTEISEYTRMAVLHIHSDLQANRQDNTDTETAH